MKGVTRYITYLFFILTPVFLLGQAEVIIKLDTPDDIPLKATQYHSGLILETNLNHLTARKLNTKSGEFYTMHVPGLLKQFGEGQPNIPVVSKLIEVPGKESFQYSIEGYHEEIIKLSDYQIEKTIIPAQPSVNKNSNVKSITHYFDKGIYQADEFLYDDIIKIEYIGEMRGRHLAYVQLFPIQYNPVRNQLKILNHLKINIHFTESFDSDPQYHSPAFNNIIDKTVLTKSGSIQKGAMVEGPIKYVIISDPMFESTLQPFVEWKTKCGYQVIVGYTDDPAVGATNSTIKAYLQDLYENPPEGEKAPSYVLFVGDVDQIPSWNSRTDLPYCEYTQDRFPDVLYGRFSAESIDELEPQIQKTLEYEQYAFAVDTFLNKTVLIAGYDSGDKDVRYGDGQIYYADQEYFNADNNISSFTYLSSVSSSSRQAIIDNINDGVSFANYTAHCDYMGWSNPALSRSDIGNLTNSGKYPLMIGNCCQSARFEYDDAFGEKVVMAENKGAIGYIGGSRDTYWDEDFYFSVGLNSLAISAANAALHAYENTGPGFYDGLFHTHGEAIEDWYVSNAQIIAAGNLAVESSTSSLKEYYWEIYHLFGDPSLKTYIGTPTNFSVTHHDNIPAGTTSFAVSSESYAHVTLSENGIILDSKIADETGNVTLWFDPLENTGSDQLDLIITGQNKIPYIEKISVINPVGPYIVWQGDSINDASENHNGMADFGEQISIEPILKNVGNETASNVLVSLITDDQYIVNQSLNISVAAGDVASGQTIQVPDNFIFELSDSMPDQSKILFHTSITDDSEQVYESSFEIVVNAPDIILTDYQIDDTETGNDNGILDPNEQAKLSFGIKNAGHADIQNLVASLTNLYQSDTILSIVITQDTLPELPANSSEYELQFEVFAKDGLDPGTFADIRLDITAGKNNQYALVKDHQITIGVMPEILIIEGGEKEVINAYFYDSGGETGNYLNNENYTITLLAAKPSHQLQADFEMFDVELNTSGGCWDVLKIYDGPNTSSDLLGSFCNENPPALIESNNPDGALTFVFQSDVSETRQGWKALVRCKRNTQNVTFSVHDGEKPIPDAKVSFFSTTRYTDNEGIAIFHEIPYGTVADFVVTRLGFKDVTGTIEILNNDITREVEMVKSPDFNARFVVTANGAPINDVQIEIDNRLYTTNSEGIALIDSLFSELYYTYSLTKSGFLPKTDSFLISEEDIVIPVNLIPENPYLVYFVVKNQDGIPFENAFIEAGDSTRYTNSNGVASLDLFPGVYEYRISAEHYDTIQDSIFISDHSVSIDTALSMSFYEVSFMVHSSENRVENAIIEIGDQADTTDAEGMAQFYLTYGNYSYSIAATGYHATYNNLFEIIKDTSISHEIDAILFEATFLIKDQNNLPIPSCSIRVNNEIKVTNEEGMVAYQLSVGRYNCFVSAAGYEDVWDQVIIEAKDSTYTVFLDPIQYEAQIFALDQAGYGIEEALVTVDSTSKMTDRYGKTEFVLQPGTYHYSIIADQFDPIENRTFDITDQNIEIFDTLFSNVIITYQISFKVTDGTDPLPNAAVMLGSKTRFTNSEGETIFEDCLKGETNTFIVMKTGFENDTGYYENLHSNLHFDIVLEKASSIAHIEHRNLDIYPNPTSGQLFIEFALDESLEMKLFDITGNLIEMDNLKSGKTEINLEYLDKGMYLLELNSVSLKKVVRIIKK